MEKNALEGQKEIEVLELKAGGNFYGVNVDEIKEIIPYNKKATPVPNSHPLIEGIIMPRDFLIPIIDLVKGLSLKDVDDYKREMLVVSSVYDMNIAFHVDSVHGIRRVMTSNINKPGKKLSTSAKNFVIGVIEIQDRRIELLELKKIIDDINPNLA